MKKGISAFFLLVTVAASAAGAFEQNPHIVTADNAPPQEKKNSTLPPVIMEKYEYYEVCGCCEADLERELKQKCITWNDGKKYDSITNWTLKWDYSRVSASGLCAAQSFTVKVDITFQLPKWARTADAPQQLMEKWDKYQKNLLAHEQGHRDIAVEAARGLTQAVSELPPARTCAELDRDVQALTDKMGKKLGEEQKAYDAATNHGRTQGVIFP